MIATCKEAGTDLKSSDIERYHRKPIVTINTSSNTHVIVKFVNKKH